MIMSRAKRNEIWCASAKVWPRREAQRRSSRGRDSDWDKSPRDITYTFLLLILISQTFNLFFYDPWEASGLFAPALCATSVTRYVTSINVQIHWLVLHFYTYHYAVYAIGQTSKRVRDLAGEWYSLLLLSLESVTVSLLDYLVALAYYAIPSS